MLCKNGSLGFVFKSGILNFARFLENEEMDAFAESGVDDRDCKLRSGSGGGENSHDGEPVHWRLRP